jgi:hypothetical protein
MLALEHVMGRHLAEDREWVGKTMRGYTARNLARLFELAHEEMVSAFEQSVPLSNG